MNTIFILIFILICVLVGYLLYAKINPSKKSNIKELYAEGLDLLVSGKRKNAYNNFKEIIEKDSNNIMAYLRLGQILRENGNYVKAIKIHKNLLVRKKISIYEQIEVYKNLSKDYYKINNYVQSIKQCEEILLVDKHNDWALKQLVKLYREENQWESAEKYLKLFFEINNINDDSKIALFKIHQAKILIENKNYLDARETLEKALSLDKNNYMIYYFLGKSYSEESNLIYEDAISIEKKGLEHYNNQEEYSKYIDDAKAILSKAIPSWTHFCEIEPNQSWIVLPLLRDALFVLERYSEMEDILNKLSDKFPDNIEILASLADYYSHKDELDKAIETIDLAIEKDDKDYLARLIKIKFNLDKTENQYTKDLDELIYFISKKERIRNLHNSGIHNDYKALLDIDE